MSKGKTNATTGYVDKAVGASKETAGKVFSSRLQNEGAAQKEKGQVEVMEAKNAKNAKNAKTARHVRVGQVEARQATGGKVPAPANQGPPTMKVDRVAAERKVLL